MIDNVYSCQKTHIGFFDLWDQLSFRKGKMKITKAALYEEKSTIKVKAKFIPEGTQKLVPSSST